MDRQEDAGNQKRTLVELFVRLSCVANILTLLGTALLKFEEVQIMSVKEPMQVNDIGFTIADVDSRIADLEGALVRFQAKVDFLKIRVEKEQQRPNVQTMPCLVAEFQKSCAIAREELHHYKSAMVNSLQTSEEASEAYINITEQLLKIGKFTRIVQIIIEDVPGFINRSV